MDRFALTDAQGARMEHTALVSRRISFALEMTAAVYRDVAHSNETDKSLSVFIHLCPAVVDSKRIPASLRANGVAQPRYAGVQKKSSS